MTVFVALARAINVGGRNSIAMADLRAMLAELGFAEARTLLQSGNAVFKATGRSNTAFERRLETETEKSFGVRANYFVRSLDEWKRIVARNPFQKQAVTDPAHLVAVCLKDKVAPEKVARLRAAIRGPETVSAVGRELYAVFPSGIGNSKLTSALIESKLETRGTARNWNTVLKLLALAEELV